jgi:TPR repeat protein
MGAQMSVEDRSLSHTASPDVATRVTWRWNGRKQRATVLPYLLLAAAFLQACDQSSTANKSPETERASAPDSVSKSESGDRDAMLSVAQAHDRGTSGVKKDARLAFEWYLRAAEAGHPQAMGEVAKRYRAGVGVRGDWEASVTWADKGAEKGDAQSIYLALERDFSDYLLLRYGEAVESESEERGLILNSAKQLELLRKAADGGNVDAMLFLGSRLRHGYWYWFKGKRKVATGSDADSAQRWFETASNKGSAIATLLLAQWLQSGGDGISPQPDRAAKYWDTLEGTVTPDEQYALGHQLMPGDKKYFKPTVWRDRQLTYDQAAWSAREWLQKSAQQGNPQAALELANALTSGKFLWGDEKEAYRYLLQAAEADLFGGQTGVAWAYYNGLGVAKNYTKAYTWALRAATHPTATANQMAGAQRFLAYLLSQGHGTEQDLVLAYAWASVSAANGDKDAKASLDALEVLLDTAQIRESQQISGAWSLGKDMRRLPGTSSSAGSTEASGAEVTDGVGIKLVATGTGFFINADGMIVTNHHVVAKCSEIRVSALGKAATLETADQANDLAVLKTDGKVGVNARLADATKLRQGQEIATFGFPLDGYLPATGNITTGLISALSGPSNNSSLIQISTPVQPGSSGGPVLNMSGEVVGVVVGKADAIGIARVTGDILQNVNFAISAGTLRAFLESNRIEYSGSSLVSFTKRPDALADEARKFTTKIECWL